MLKVYIGFDSTNYGQEMAYEVCKRSIRKYNKNVEINKIVRKELIDNKLFWRKDNSGVTEFTYTRFLVPYLNNYEGWAIFCDSDFLWNCDIEEVFKKYADNKYAVCCVKHNYKNCHGKTKMDGRPQEYYPRKNWSSLMLFNCSHPSIKNLTPENVSTQTPQWLHRMYWAKDEEIGEINKSYNYLVGYYDDNNINALHYTDGGPWHPGYENVEHGEKWLEYINKEEKQKIDDEISEYYKKYNNITIFTVCDLSYFNQFEIFAKSYIINETNKDKVKYIHFFIYKTNEDKILIKQKIKNYYSKFINFKLIKYNNYNIKFRYFCCHYRFEAFNYLKDKNNNLNEILIYSDIDAYINKSLLNKFDIFKESAYFFIRTNKYEDKIINKTNFNLDEKDIHKIGKTYFLSGVIVIKNDNIGKNIIKYLLTTYNNIHKEWYADQKTLDKIFFSKKFKIGILSRYYFDLTLNKQNLLLLCKGLEFPEDRVEWQNLIKQINIKFDNQIKNNDQIKINDEININDKN